MPDKKQQFKKKEKKQQLERDMEQQTGSKSGKKYIKAVYCHPAYLGAHAVKCWAG